MKPERASGKFIVLIARANSKVPRPAPRAGFSPEEVPFSLTQARVALFEDWVGQDGDRSGRPLTARRFGELLIGPKRKECSLSHASRSRAHNLRPAASHLPATAARQGR